MADTHEDELRWALAEGILGREEVDALREQAERLDQGPLELLVAAGRLSAETLAQLRAGTAATKASLGGVSTLDATPAGQARAAASTDFPVPGWDRYEPVRFLGQGGMGRVFLANDLRLRRQVALKFVRGDAPELVRRFVSEARSQARVEHERVCKVYEVGEVAGRVYIAMQYLDGRPLTEAAPTLTLEQKVMVVREAARGLHAAHQVGLVHRDVKPGNILVERSEDGRLLPYVMDFGLARDWTEGTTMTGAVLGTPHYMSPEQARGEVSRIDRRADVYSLGATLYRVLTGEPPIPGDNALEVLSRIAALEPRPPRALDQGIPVDLEAIVLKCLEKERAARYDSARALAEDLDRFLAGDPVVARPAGLWYRLRKRARKHRVVVSLGAAALLVAGLGLGWAGHERREAARRERLARRFTEQVEAIEAHARYSDLSPPHDTRADHKALRVRMDELAAEIRAAGGAAVGPGHYALGRGQLALGDVEAARGWLESAWAEGNREPRVAYALALVWGRLYQQKLREANLGPGAAEREARRREAERRYRDPALAYLRQSTGAEVPSTQYVAALLAFYEDRLDAALAELDAIGGKLPWFYEAPALRGDILVARATRHWDQGEEAEALADFEAGRRAYAGAAAIGESVPAVYQALGELEYAAMLMELYGRGRVMPQFERGIAAVARALAVAPDHYLSLVLKARFHRRLAEDRVNHGEPVDDLLTEALASAEAALRLAPQRPEARLELGRLYYQWGKAKQERNLDPRELLGRARTTLEGLGAAERDYEFHLYIGLAAMTGANYEDQIGADSLAERERAIAAFRAAIALDPQQTPAWVNLGTTYFQRATHPRDPDPDGDLTEARAAFERARALNPKHVVSYFYGGQVLELLARRKRARGGDIRPDLAAALALYRRGLEINPGLPQLYNAAGTILIEEAKETWDHGGDPFPLLAEARASFEKAIAAAPGQGFGQLNAGVALAQRAVFELARQEDPTASIRAAMAALEQATARIPEYPGPWANLGWAHALQATFELGRGRDPSPSLERAQRVLERALELNPQNADAWLYLGEMRGIRARWRARKEAVRDEDFRAAAAAFERALELALEPHEARVTYGHFCRAWAAVEKAGGRDLGPALQRALVLGDEVLKARSAWPEARVLRASVLLALAEAAQPGEERRVWEEQAAEDFRRAFTINPNLERAWKAQAARAQRFASTP